MREALRLEPDNVNLILATAYVRAGSGLVDQARELFSRAVDVAPSDPRSYLGLARTFLAQSKPEQALDTLKRGTDKVQTDDIRRLGLLRLLAQVQLDVVQRQPGNAGTEAAGKTEGDSRGRQEERGQGDNELRQRPSGTAAEGIGASR